MIQVGLVGVGPQWERFRPALANLRQPIEVEAVYDPIFARAENAARDLDADPVYGISALAGQGNVDAILVMDPGWTRTTVLPLLARQPKPVFFAPWPFSGRDRTRRLEAWQTDSDSLIVPALWRRFFPAAIRLQELIVTELGQPSEVIVDLAGRSASEEHKERQVATSAADSSLESIVGWLDFCRTLFRASPESASIHEETASENTPTAANRFFEFEIIYPPLVSNKEPTSAVDRNRIARLTLRLPDDKSITPEHFVQNLMAGVRSPSLLTPALYTAETSQTWIPEIRLRCEHGNAEVTSTIQIVWQTDSEEPVQETLASERSEEEIMLDIFCRRVVGGLVPVANLSDIIKPIQLIRSCINS